VHRQIVLISHEVKMPQELENYCARFDMALPSEKERARIIKNAAREYAKEHPGQRVKVDAKAHELLIQNLAGLTWSDTERLARNAIYLDGARRNMTCLIVVAHCISSTTQPGSMTSADWHASKSG
jgi:hypothetical protein